MYAAGGQGMNHPFDVEDPDPTVTEAWGIRWLVFWRMDGNDMRLFMRQGETEIEIAEPSEWHALLADASQAAGVEISCDLACERLKMLLERRR
jgi:hypothetical protein